MYLSPSINLHSPLWVTFHFETDIASRSPYSNHRPFHSAGNSHDFPFRIPCEGVNMTINISTEAHMVNHIPYMMVSYTWLVVYYFVMFSYDEKDHWLYIFHLSFSFCLSMDEWSNRLFLVYFGIGCWSNIVDIKLRRKYCFQWIFEGFSIELRSTKSCWLLTYFQNQLFFR
jgi:hypothetical protein